ncbi:hypothetical protein L6270_00800 [Candidatus Parcubacteria bacterium]|nr:hypothetical protein [Patescibacteria group bacterium]MBU4309687.1 hypothetical protein [Patescibacteria group bacterium]MBU4431689.1 hypothetical protein [Patescibacteria group bacterium]MBU4577925.1 hypothetical protein [Patescibacteria group bacterium]MCG2696565.1 hypothetical protein [Candidatus Parcubacteria bacterium]
MNFVTLTKRKKVIIVAVTIFVLIVFFALVSYLTKRNAQNNLPTVVVNDTSFDGQVKDFNEIYKKTLVALNDNKKDVAEKGMQEVLAYWLVIEKNFINSKPKEYITTRNWEEKIDSITDLNRLANDLMQSGDYVGAYDQLAKVRQKIKQLREENRVKNISNNFLSLSDEVDKITKIENREEVLKALPMLKINFTEAKEFYPGDQVYQTMMVGFAEVISDIENSSDTTYKKNRDRLKPSFLEIYLKFG